MNPVVYTLPPKATRIPPTGYDPNDRSYRTDYEGTRRCRTSCASRVCLFLPAPAIVDVPALESIKATDERIRAALVAVTDRLSNLESSQRVRDDDERMLGTVERGMFA